ncbi:MAG: hypothetical protein PHD43_17990 [Methylococcales bacterium]|nr:hypothetical protein [Methylococcales bacterium]
MQPIPEMLACCTAATRFSQIPFSQEMNMKHTSMRFTGLWAGIFLTLVPFGDPDVGADGVEWNA